ncbi:SDR family oxidoreductase [Pseudonocardia ailaonensis]|uniref:SDR family oxidoreductase n=1 Tax=Pseudonocardia ailaonensis TaxID=367279 RepID=UPI0031DDC52A
MVIEAGWGLGRVVARALLGDGCTVVLAGPHLDSLSETADGHARAIVVPADVSDPAEVDELFASVPGRLDLLVNSMGQFGPTGTPDEISVDDWKTTVSANLTNAFICARAAFAAMRRQRPQGGRIVNIGSISAHVPRPESIAYTAAKHAITGLTRSLSLDGRPFNIACGQIDVGNATRHQTAGVRIRAQQADGSVRSEPTFDAVYVGAAIRFMASLPLDANAQFLTLAATTMPYVGRG